MSVARMAEHGQLTRLVAPREGTAGRRIFRQQARTGQAEKSGERAPARGRRPGNSRRMAVVVLPRRFGKVLVREQMSQQEQRDVSAVRVFLSSRRLYVPAQMVSDDVTPTVTRCELLA